MSQTHLIRELLLEAFSDEEFKIFCFDFHRTVHAQFAAGMTRPAMIQLLIEHCDRNDSIEALVAQLGRARPGFALPATPPLAAPTLTTPPLEVTVGERPVTAGTPGLVQRNPYTWGGVVRGARFYGRSRLISAVLDGGDRATWIVGCRRIGKTSLLHRLKELASERGWVPFFCNLEAADTAEELAHTLLDDLDDNDPRLTRLGMRQSDLAEKTFPEIMRLLDRRARAVGTEVVLLCDEAEALLGLAAQEGDALLKELRRALQASEALRVVIAATKQLEELNDMCREWDTSPFLFGITPRYLGSLEPHETATLIRQAQSGSAVAVSDEVAATIARASGGHPFLTQWLCGERLWDGSGLRAPGVDDLIPDGALIDLFQLDYNHLSAIERQILRYVTLDEPIGIEPLLGRIGATIPEVQLRYLVQSLAQLCYVLREGEAYRVGNRLLHSWLQFGEVAEPAPRMSDLAATELADEDQQQLIQRIVQHKRRRRGIEEQLRHDSALEPELAPDLGRLNEVIGTLEQELAQLRDARQG